MSFVYLSIFVMPVCVCVHSFEAKIKMMNRKKGLGYHRRKPLMRGVRLIRTVVLRHTHIEEVVSGDLQLVSVENAGA